MNLRVRLIRWVLAKALLAGIALLCAGSVSLPALREYLVVFSAVGLVSTLTIKPDLAQERSQPAGEGIDPPIRHAASTLFIATVALGSLDVGRLHWAFPFSTKVQSAALVVFIAANALQIWAMAVNIFFSTRLRLQPERGHYLVSHGPYRFVRHPGYLTMLLIVPSTAFALGSTLALLPAAVYGALILSRAAREDRFLLMNLPGYADYVRGVPYHLIPGVW
jgi:protein-S-isoprenylcysteine O-methyltransferase Ste14